MAGTALLYAWCAAMAPGAHSQVAEAASAVLDASGAASYEVTVVFRRPAALPPEPRNAPFSAEEAVTRRGGHAEETESRGKVWRDSEGRVRRERPVLLGRGIGERPVVVEITDAVAGYQYVLDARLKIAHRWRMARPGEGEPRRVAPVGGAMRAATATSDGRVSQGASEPGVADEDEAEAPVAARPEADGAAGLVEEPLGERAIEGVVVKGTRRTRVLAAGAEERPRFTVAETWRSEELGLVLRTRLVDAAGREEIVEWMGLRRDEPPGALFRPPPGYTVQDARGSVRMVFAAR